MALQLPGFASHSMQAMALKDLHKNGVLTSRELKAAVDKYSRNLHWYDEFFEIFTCDGQRLRSLKRYRDIRYPSTLRSLLQHARTHKSVAIYEFAQDCRSRFAMENSPVGHVAGPQFETVLEFQFADTERYLGMRETSDVAFRAMRESVGNVLNSDLGMAGTEAVESALWAGRSDYIKEAKEFVEDHHSFGMESILAYARAHGRAALIDFAGAKPSMNSPLNDGTALGVDDLPLVAGLLETVLYKSQQTHLAPLACAEATLPFDVVSAAVLFVAGGNEERARALDATREKHDLNTDRFAAFALGDYETDAWLYSNRDCIMRLIHFDRIRERFVRDRVTLKALSGAALAPAIDAMAILELDDDVQASALLQASIKAVAGDPQTRASTLELIVHLALFRNLPFHAYKAAQKIPKSSTSHLKSIAAVARGYAKLGDVAGALVVAEKLGQSANITSRTADGAIVLAAFRQIQRPANTR